MQKVIHYDQAQQFMANIYNREFMQLSELQLLLRWASFLAFPVLSPAITVTCQLKPPLHRPLNLGLGAAPSERILTNATCRKCMISSAHSIKMEMPYPSLQGIKFRRSGKTQSAGSQISIKTNKRILLLPVSVHL